MTYTRPKKKSLKSVLNINDTVLKKNQIKVSIENQKITIDFCKILEAPFWVFFTPKTSKQRFSKKTLHALVLDNT